MLRKLRKAALHQPLERLLTARARQALDLAEREARAQRHDRVTADHLLTGLARLEESVAVRTLDSLGVDLGGTRTRAMSADLVRLTEVARREAAGLGHRYIGTEHLLLGLLHEDGTEALGVGLQQARDQIIKVLHGDVL
ncbi:Clp protease N-terminal domain-containing protein [Acrocarpospora corrugata]|uniref:Clp protease N-terminal domain-containing protein n=1 Tax=Acrocarpospora corrugata TaxID=35763 RepID=UPI0012D2F54F|nr:Clp protease N-terminal domain-containing protein [Acrocarpospora corrugata]